MFVKQRLIWAGIIFVFLIFPVIVIWFDPNVDLIGSRQSFCPFKLLTGLPCPGCGCLKSMINLYRGEIVQSMRYHLLGIPLMVLFVAGFAVLIISAIRKKDIPMPWLYNMKLAYGVAIALGTYHLVRLAVYIATHSFYEIARESVWM